MMILPKLFIAEIQVFNIQPVSVGEYIHRATAVQLGGAGIATDLIDYHCLPLAFAAGCPSSQLNSLPPLGGADTL